MGKRERYSGERQELVDPETGRRVWRLTGNRAWNTQPTYHVNGFLDDDRVVFVAEDGGSTNIYVSEFSSGEVVQLTEGEGRYYRLHRGMNNDGDGEGKDAFHMVAGYRSHEVYFVQGDLLKGVNADTLEERVLCSLGGEWLCGVLELSGDESVVLAPLLAAECFRGSSDLAEYLRRCDRRNLPSRVLGVTAATGRTAVLWEERGRFIGHAMLSPTSNRYILADRATDPDRPEEPLLWVIDVEKQETWPLQTRSPKTGHSSWLWDGLGVLTHGVVQSGEPAGAEYIQILERDGRSRWIGYHPPPRYYGHCHSTPGGTVVTDAIFRPDAITAVRPAGAGYARQTLCVHGTSWPGHGQLTHPHPHVSPDGRWIVFGSYRDGRKDVYLLDASDV